MTYIYHLLLGFCIGYVFAIPTGPVNLAIMQAAIDFGRQAGYRMAVGCATSEWLYSLISILGGHYASKDSGIFFYIRIASVPVLFVLGLMNLIYPVKHKKEVDTEGEEVKQKMKNVHHLFWFGLSLNLLNPFLLPFWFTLTSSLNSYHWMGTDVLAIMLFSLGVFVGTFALQAMLANLSAKWKVVLSMRTRMLINRIIGFVFLSYSIYAGIRLFLEYNPL